MPGYWQDPERTAEVLRSGWHHTGDAGSVDEEGFPYVRDRYKDMIISGGENVYPAEVESAMLEFADVRRWRSSGSPTRPGVRSAWPSSYRRRAPTPDGEELRTRLAAFKVPAYVELTDQLLKTATGKIRKPDLRDRFVTTEENPA
jgi:acyl-CoA synthetase (AMP-forming)/AMP-acid ligase II